MPCRTISIPDDLFRRLSEQAKALNRSVEEYVEPALRYLAEYGEPLGEGMPLTDEEWERRVGGMGPRCRGPSPPPTPGLPGRRQPLWESMYFGSDKAGSWVVARDN